MIPGYCASSARLSTPICRNYGLRVLSSPSVATIPTLLADIIRRRGISERQLAAYMGVSPAAMNRWIKGQGTPDPTYCWKIAELAGLPIEHVMRIAGHLPQEDERSAPDPPWLSALISEIRALQVTPEEAQILDVTLRGLLALREERERYGDPGQPAQETGGS